MDVITFKLNSFAYLHRNRCRSSKCLKKRLCKWQQVRTWARVIREAEALWHLDVRELRMIGAVELSQLIQEVPPSYRRRVDRWLAKYTVSPRFYPGSRQLSLSQYKNN